MKIAIVGCGAIGSYYGAKLCQGGNETHFLLRSDYEVVRRYGVQVEGANESFRIHPRCARQPEEIGESDLVIIGLKTTANDQFERLLRPLVGPRTALLTLQNGRILFGEFQRWPEPRTHDLASLLRHAGIPCQVADRLDRAHWLKLVWNIPFNGLGVASTAGYESVLSGVVPADAGLSPVLATDALLNDPRWHALVLALMREVIAIANQLGLEIPLEYAEQECVRTVGMGAYRASTLIDFERGHPLELDSLFFEPLRKARACGISTPHLERLSHLLGQLDRVRSLSGGLSV